MANLDSLPHTAGFSRWLVAPVFFVIGVFSAPAAASPDEMMPLLEESIKLQKKLLAKPEAPITRLEQGPALKSGSAGARVLKLNTRLAELGYLTGKFDDKFGHETEAAVRAFQAAAGLVVDGVVDHQTRFSLNLSDQEKVEILRAQLEEMERFYKANEDKRYIIVNVPGYTLRAYDDNKKVLESKVVVGGVGRQTPLMKTNLTALIYHPTWSPPKTILAKDIFKDGELSQKAVARMGLKLIDAEGKSVDMKETQITTPDDLKNGGYRFMQPAGERNALGLLKFHLDNRHDIYMHDTNHRELFVRQSRAMSSGCIRVDSFRELAAWVTGKTPAEIEKELLNRRTRRLEVDKIPVYIVYRIADMNGGKVVFNRDIYSRIRLPKRVLAAPSEKKKLSAAP